MPNKPITTTTKSFTDIERADVSGTTKLTQDDIMAASASAAELAAALATDARSHTVGPLRFATMTKLQNLVAIIANSND